jgi:predicted ATPase with chaperone activity
MNYKSCFQIVIVLGIFFIPRFANAESGAVTDIICGGISSKVVQVQISSGLPSFTIVGLPDKAVAESKERVRGALHALGLSLPAKHLTVNLAPADLSKEGSHFDLPIALGLLAAMDVIPKDSLENFLVLGELSLDASIRPVAGILPAAMHASSNDNRLICPEDCGGEAAWAGGLGYSRAARSAAAHQSHQGHASYVAASGEARQRAIARRARYFGSQRAGDGEACVRDRGGGRA